MGIIADATTVTMRLAGTPAQVYQIEASTNVLNWVKLGQATAGTNGLFEFTDGDKRLHPRRYYRARQ